MENIDVLLSDEFASFANKIAEICAEKKNKKQELKAFFDKIQEDLNALDEKAKTLASDFDSWAKKEEIPDGQS